MAPSVAQSVSSARTRLLAPTSPLRISPCGPMRVTNSGTCVRTPTGLVSASSQIEFPRARPTFPPLGSPPHPRRTRPRAWRTIWPLPLVLQRRSLSLLFLPHSIPTQHPSVLWRLRLPGLSRFHSILVKYRIGYALRVEETRGQGTRIVHAQLVNDILAEIHRPSI